MTVAFEARYRAEPDPWRTATDPVERAKAQDALAACGPGPFARAAELGCGIGVLTAALAPRCRELVAIDAAPTAVAAARARLAAYPHAQVTAGAVPDALPAGPFDLVVASEILYYLPGAALERTLAWLEDALAPGGRVVAVHWSGSAPDLETDAASLGAALAARAGLRLLASETRDTYRLEVLCRG